MYSLCTAFWDVNFDYPELYSRQGQLPSGLSLSAICQKAGTFDFSPQNLSTSLYQCVCPGAVLRGI